MLVLGRLALTRFDLAAGIAILLAGYCARSPGRAGAWIGLAGALKLVPLAAAPALTRRGSSLRLLAAAAAVPLVAQGAYALWSGEPGLSWIGYHAGRDPEIESWAAVLRRRRARPRSARGHGLRARQPERDRHERALAGPRASRSPRSPRRCCVARRARRADADPALALLAALALLVTLAPVLSPQYLLWLAPLSAYLAPRVPLQALLLAAASVLTRVELHFAFDDLPSFDWGAIALVALRNAALAAFAVVLWRAVGGLPRQGAEDRPGRLRASRS